MGYTRRMLVPFFVLLNALGTFSLPALPLIELEDETHSISEINEAAGLHLFGGDIMESDLRSSTTNPNRRWNTSVPYVLGSRLDLSAKGIILRALEQFRLKTCIDFIPRFNQKPYISIQKRQGCYSYIGQVASVAQTVSIGTGCAIIDTVEHELLHALGFYHEQSRYDRDEHVTIVWENIREGYENNFNKVSEDFSSLLNTSYDYTSVMHYGENFFTNGNGSTILTKKPEFQDVIGNSVEMSPTDALELNRLYRCNASVTFRQNCSFDDEGMCEMTVCSRGSPEWLRVSRIDGGPHSDHTHLSTEKQGSGLFMYFSTVKGKEGDSSRLITKRMTPTRPCQVQCLQFYYYYNGNEMDQLNIWIREFESKDDVEGTRRLMGQITGSPADYWKIHHVPLNASNTFQVEFEGRKGAGASSGGFSVDDINLSETECPHHTWQIRNFEELLNSSVRSEIYSPRYYTPDGYSYQILLYLRSTYFGLYLRMVSGDYDAELEWPFAWRQLSAVMVDQNPRMQLHMSKLRTITTDPGAMINAEQSLWDNPREVGSLTEVNGETFYASYAVGRAYFMTLDDLRKRDFLKGGDAVISFSMQDIRPLLTNNSLPCPGIPQQNFTSVPTDSDYSCARVTTTTTPTTTTSPTTTPTTTTSPTTTSTTTTTTSPTTTTTSPTTTTTSPTTTSTTTTTSPTTTTTSPTTTTTSPTTTTTSPTTTTTSPTTTSTTTTTSPTTTTTSPTTTSTTTTTTTEGPDVDGNCDSFLCSFSPKTTCCPLILLFTLLLLLSH